MENRRRVEYKDRNVIKQYNKMLMVEPRKLQLLTILLPPALLVV